MTGGKNENDLMTRPYYLHAYTPLQTLNTTNQMAESPTTNKSPALQNPLLDRFGKIFPDVGVVAGSAALHGYLTSLGETPEWTANDIDIWVPVDGISPALCSAYVNRHEMPEEVLGALIVNPVIERYRKLRDQISAFFRNARYYNVPADMAKQGNDNKYPTSNILTVHTYEKCGNKIQVIFTTGLQYMYDVVDPFDFDCLKVTYDITNSFFQVPDDIKQVIEKRSLFHANNRTYKEVTPRFLARLKKYNARGFSNYDSVYDAIIQRKTTS